jgi:hypothetical protein
LLLCKVEDFVLLNKSYILTVPFQSEMKDVIIAVKCLSHDSLSLLETKNIINAKIEREEIRLQSVG